MGEQGYFQNLAVNIGADLLGALVTIFIITPIIDRYTEGRVREHPLLDYDFYLGRVSGSTAVVRMQAPVIRRINGDPRTWVSMWRELTRLGAVPYYMFVERDTGPQDCFAVPLARAHEIFREAYRQVSGLARTIRGPIMSATPGKVCVDGVADIAGERVFALHLVQAREPELVGRPFFARYDPGVTWLDELRPALGATSFPFEEAAGSKPTVGL